MSLSCFSWWTPIPYGYSFLFHKNLREWKAMTETWQWAHALMGKPCYCVSFTFIYFPLSVSLALMHSFLWVIPGDVDAMHPLLLNTKASKRDFRHAVCKASKYSSEETFNQIQLFMIKNLLKRTHREEICQIKSVSIEPKQNWAELTDTQVKKCDCVTNDKQSAKRNSGLK